jgi:hypothetical protein
VEGEERARVTRIEYLERLRQAKRLIEGALSAMPDAFTLDARDQADVVYAEIPGPKGPSKDPELQRTRDQVQRLGEIVLELVR